MSATVLSVCTLLVFNVVTVDANSAALGAAGVHHTDRDSVILAQ